MTDDTAALAAASPPEITAPDTAAFEAQLAADGFAAVPKTVPADTVLPEHVHDFEARALVTAGEISITCDGETRTYRAGEIFTMAQGKPHAERIGPDGVSYVAGRRG